MSTITRIDVGPRMSEAVILGNRIHCSGMIPEDTSHGHHRPGPAGAGRESPDAPLAKGGSDKTKILTATIWLSDISDFAAMNKVSGTPGSCRAKRRPAPPSRPG